MFVRRFETWSFACQFVFSPSIFYIVFRRLVRHVAECDLCKIQSSGVCHSSPLTKYYYIKTHIQTKMSNAKDENHRYANDAAAALQSPMPHKLRQLVADGFDIYQKVRVGLGPNSYTLLLFHAIDKRKCERVQFLLDLHLAIPPKSFLDAPDRILAFLIFLHTDMGASDLEGKCRAIVKVGRKCEQKSLHDCVLSFWPRHIPLMLKSLIKAGADVRLVYNKDFETPLLYKLSPECMQMFIEHGVRVNDQSEKDNRSAMHYMVRQYFDSSGRDDKRNLQILMAHGAAMNLRDAQYKTPLQYLSYEQVGEMVEMQAHLDGCRKSGQDLIAAFCMAGVPRLGVNSLALEFPPEVFEMMGKRLKMEENYQTLRIAGVLP